MSEPDSKPGPDKDAKTKPAPAEEALKKAEEGKPAAKSAESAAAVNPKPAKKSFISFVGRLRKSSRKAKAAAAVRPEPIPEVEKKPEPKSSATGLSRSATDEIVKPIRAEDLSDKGVPAAPGDKNAVPGKLSIEKVQRLGTRSERRKTEAKPGQVVDEKAEQRRRNVVAGFKIGLAVMFFVVAGILVYLSLRETRVKMTVETSPAFEINPEVLVVSDIEERVELIKRDLHRREEPIRAALAGVEQDLAAAQADHAGRSRRRQLLMEAWEKDKKEIPAILETSQKSLEKLWKEDADNLDAEYEKRKNGVNSEIAARAKQLNLAQFAPSDELDAPEISVNAFRLALYSAPDGVDTAKERQWAETKLKGWRKYEEDWSDRQLKIKQEADALRQTVQPEIDEVKGRLVVRQEEIAAVDLEIEEFSKEVARHEEKKKESKEELSALGQPFYEDLLKIFNPPSQYVLMSWTMDKEGVMDIRNLDRDPNFTPGEYRLLVKAKKKGVDYWALKTFTVNQYKTTQIELKDADFFPVKSLLENK